METIKVGGFTNLQRISYLTSLGRSYLENNDMRALSELSGIALGRPGPARRLIRFIENTESNRRSNEREIV